MNPLRSICLMMGLLLAVVYAADSSRSKQKYSGKNSVSNIYKPSEWLSPYELESLPALTEITFELMESMSPEEGAKFLQKYYHLSQIENVLHPSYVPSPSEVPVYYFTCDNKKVDFSLNQFLNSVKQQPYFGKEEVTIFITGLPPVSETIRKATRKLVNAYMQRYNGHRYRSAEGPKAREYLEGQNSGSFTGEDDDEPGKPDYSCTGNLIIIDLGSVFKSFKQYLTLDIEKTGEMLGKIFVELTNEVDVPYEIMHIIGQGIGAHVAGAAGRTYVRYTGHQLRRITGLDPSPIYAKDPYVLSGLCRGDADFVDVIHTSIYGMGTPSRCGDVDFYPGGPGERIPGTDNIVEASVRATRYFAESVVPGYEHNFPAYAANSLEEYKDKKGYGKCVYMGIDVDYDLKGDYILQVNAKGPFGRNAPSHMPHPYHGIHGAWKGLTHDYK